MQFVYTDSGLKELTEFQKQQQKLLEEVISSRKYVFGDEVVEITRADVKQAAQHIKPISEITHSKYAATRLAAGIYIFVGIMLFAAGITWPYLRALYTRDRFSFMLALAGLAMSIIGYSLLQIMRARARQAESLELTRQLFRNADVQRVITAKNLKEES